MSRPEKPIDWKRVDDLILAGCNGIEIAPHFNIHYTNFYERVQKEYGVTFTEYAAQLYPKGDSLLKAKQFEKAIKGDNAMLTLLGKYRLGQRDLEKDLASLKQEFDDFRKWMDNGKNPVKEQCDQ